MIFSAKKPQAPFDFYLMSVHVGVCHGPVDSIKALTAQDKIFWEGNATSNTTLTILQDGLFGGFRREGGLVGGIDVMMGDPAQVLSAQQAGFLSLTPATAPGYRGVTSLWFRKDFSIPKGIYDGRKQGFYWGTQPVVPPVSVKVTRNPRQLNSAFSSIGVNPDANPIHIIFECLINDDWGRGVPVSAIDVAGFDAASQVLFSEGFGLSIIWSQQANIDAFIQEILDHINATFFLDPRTGLLKIKLIRGDYDVDNLREFGADDLIVNSFQRESLSETINELVVTWTNPVNEQEETVSLQDLANITIQGAIVSDSANYYGIRTAQLAMKVCARDLRLRSYPLAQVEVTCSRRAWDLNPGDVFKLNYPEYGIETLVLRIISINYGTVGSPEIVISAVEDIFGLEASEFVSPPGTQWDDPVSPPTVVENVLVTSLPYFLIANQISSPDLATLINGEAVAGIFAATSNDDLIFFDLLAERLDTASQLTYQSIGERGQVGNARITASLVPQARTIVQFNSIIGGEFPSLGQYLLLGSAETSQEICFVSAVSGSDFTIERGLCDTVPRSWAANTPAYIFNFDNIVFDTLQTQIGDIVRFKLLSVTSLGKLPEISAPIQSSAMTNRAFKPLCPGNCSVNTIKFGTATVALVANLSLAWSVRNYLVVPTAPLLWDSSPQTPVAGQQTRVQIFNSANAIIFSDLYTGDGATIPAAVLGAETTLRVRFSAENGSELSLQFFEIQVSRI